VTICGMKTYEKRRTVARWLTGAVVATAASALSAPAFAVADTTTSLTKTVVAPRQTGYDGYLCNIASLWVRQTPNDGGAEVAQVFTGDPMHVYATHNSVPSIPDGWALGYGRPHGGAAQDGYFKVGYVCT
jgi:hypothetical protein